MSDRAYARGYCGFTVALILYLASATSIGAQTAATSPETVARQYVQAMQAGDWSAVAGLMHPHALASMRELLEPMFEMPEATELRQRFLDVGTAEEAAALSDVQVFARFMRFVATQDPTVAQALQGSTVDVIGHVPEGRDTVHVVYRMTLTVEGVEMSRMDTFSLARQGHAWRGLLSGDVSALAAAIRGALGGGSR